MLCDVIPVSFTFRPRSKVALKKVKAVLPSDVTLSKSNIPSLLVKVERKKVVGGVTDVVGVVISGVGGVMASVEIVDMFVFVSLSIICVTKFCLCH